MISSGTPSEVSWSKEFHKKHDTIWYPSLVTRVVLTCILHAVSTTYMVGTLRYRTGDAVQVVECRIERWCKNRRRILRETRCFPRVNRFWAKPTWSRRCFSCYTVNPTCICLQHLRCDWYCAMIILSVSPPNSTKTVPVDHACHIQFCAWLQHCLIICSRVRLNLYMVALKHKQFCLCRSNIQSKQYRVIFDIGFSKRIDLL
jgi:hypothetical protein